MTEIAVKPSDRTLASDAVLPFRSLGKYDWPSTPVNRGMERLRERVRELTGRKEDASGIAADRLDPVPADLLERIVDAPANQPVLAELDATLDGWLSDPDGPKRLQTIVLPPCDREDLLGRWADSRGLQVFDTDRRLGELDALDDPEAAPLVIPKLEARFLRTLDGLDDVRRLLDRIATLERRAVIGCNSWAWQFLRKSCEIDLVLSEPVTFRAFDKQRLRAWLGSLAHGPGGEDTVCFRSAQSGADVFGNGEGDAEVSPYMADLAKRSLGIPWVAWHLWRPSLFLAKPEEGEETATPVDPSCDPHTVWVTPIKPLALPNRNDQNALLVLHALLIHGGLTADQIAQTVPLVSYTNVLPSLLREGLVDRVDGLYRCLPAAYPAVRDALNNNAYPVDVL